MTTVLDTPTLGFDVETTGLDKFTERIVTAALVGPDSEKTWLINPEYRIDPGASAVHGITDEKVQAEGAKASEALEEIISLIADHVSQGFLLVGYNIIYDLTILEHEARRHGLVPLSQRVELNTVADPYIIDKALNKYRKGKRTLDRLAEVFNLELDAHDASSDARVAVLVLRKLVEQSIDENKSIDVDPKLLHSWCVKWSRQQAMSFADYLRTRPVSRVENPTVPSGWPIEDQASGKEEEDFNDWNQQ